LKPYFINKKGNLKMDSLVTIQSATTSIVNVVQNDTTQAAAIQPEFSSNIGKALSDLEATREAWEAGAYKTSNLELYGILRTCLAFCGELTKSSAKARNKSLEEFYKKRGYRYKSEAPLATRVVKAVFGNVDRRRTSTYSLVIRQAQIEKIGYLDFVEWIEAKGGIQEVRLSQSATFVSPAMKTEIAKEQFENLAVLCDAKSEALSFLADPEQLGSACVLLAEQQADGSFGIKQVLRSSGVVNAAFVALYSNLAEAEKDVKKEIVAANDADDLAKAA